MADKHHTMKVMQDGMVVAEVTGTDRMRLAREAMHYATVYGQDGPCTVEGIRPEEFEELTRGL